MRCVSNQYHASSMPRPGITCRNGTLAVAVVTRKPVDRVKVDGLGVVEDGAQEVAPVALHVLHEGLGGVLEALDFLGAVFVPAVAGVCGGAGGWNVSGYEPEEFFCSFGGGGGIHAWQNSHGPSGRKGKMQAFEIRLHLDQGRHGRHARILRRCTLGVHVQRAHRGMDPITPNE